MEEVIFKQCKLCGNFYDAKEENGYKLCNRCFLQLKIKNNKGVKNDKK